MSRFKVTLITQTFFAETHYGHASCKDHSGAEKPLPPGDVTAMKCGGAARRPRVRGGAGVKGLRAAGGGKERARSCVQHVLPDGDSKRLLTVLSFLSLRCILSTYKRWWLLFCLLENRMPCLPAAA